MTSQSAAEITAVAQQALWYKDAVLYQVHVKAFFDSNNDGMGDFRGLTSKLDYIQDLGVSALWLLPFYPSPLKDDGYDVSAYHNVHPQYGTVADFKQFVREAQRRGLRVIPELVVNHTSGQHPWFQAARRAPKGSRKRDYYVWSDTDQKYKGTRVIFTDTETSNWAWDPVAKQYFWHRFFSHQPDLNFDNPHVVRAVLKVMQSWAEMGVDGFRLDAIPYLCEREGTSNENLPETHLVLKQIRAADGKRPGAHQVDKQPPALDARLADPLLRRRAGQGRQHLSRRPQRRAHADAVEPRPQRRLLARRPAAALPAADHGPDLRLRGGQRRGAAARPEQPAQLDPAHARDPQDEPRLRPRQALVPAARQPQGARLPPRADRRGDPVRRQPFARCSTGGIGFKKIQGKNSGRAARPHFVPADRRPALSADAAGTRFLLVQARHRREAAGVAHRPAAAGRSAADGAVRRLDELLPRQGRSLAHPHGRGAAQRARGPRAAALHREAA